VAAPSYTTDLNVISTCEVIGTWIEMPGHASGGAASVDGESYIQGSNCISQSTGTKTGIVCGLEFDYGSDLSGSMSAGDCFFFWQIYLAAANVYSFASGGLRASVGSSAGNRKFWKTGGNDFGKYPYGGWQNFAVDPTYTADYTDGSPTSAYQFFGSVPNIIAQVSKGNPHGVDVIRYGRGEVIIENGDAGNGYGTFAGIATQNDNQNNRWGLFQAEGVGYLWKGLLSFGNSTNACDFRDSNVNVTIEDTPRTYASFNRVEINNVNSRVDWAGVGFTAVNASQISIGQLEVIDNADVNFDTCAFTDMGTFIFQSNSTINTTIFRRCGQVTQGGAVFDGCIFDESDAAVSLYVNDLDNIDNCAFYSDGSNHAMELDTTHSGSSYTLTGCTYIGYATVSGSTGNECIYNNSGGAVTIYVVGGDQPSVRNGVGASTSLPSSITLTITVKNEAGTTISGAYAYIDNDDASPYIMNTVTNSVGVATTNYADGPVDDSIWRVRLYGYKPYRQTVDIGLDDVSIPVTLVSDPQQV
jgi:hypothetical protein